MKGIRPRLKLFLGTEVSKRIFPHSTVGSYLKNYFLTTKNYFLYETLRRKTVEYFYYQTSKSEVDFQHFLQARQLGSEPTAKKTNTCALSVPLCHPGDKASLKNKTAGTRQRPDVWFHLAHCQILLYPYCHVFCITAFSPPEQLFASPGSTNPLKKCHWRPRFIWGLTHTGDALGYLQQQRDTEES